MSYSLHLGVIKKIKTGVINVSTSTILIAMSLGGALPAFITSTAHAAGNVTVCASGCIYTSLQDAVDNVDNGGTISINSNLAVSTEVLVNKPVTINGNNHTLSGTFTKNGGVNSYLEIDSATGITVNDLTVDGTNGTNLHGINTFKTGLALNNVTLKNNGHNGLVVNGSDVTVNDITTANNGYGGIDVDQSSTSHEATLTVNGTSTHTEAAVDIYIDDSTKPVTVNDTTNQYAITYNGNGRAYNLKPAAPASTTTIVQSGDANWTTSDTRANGHVDFVNDSNAPSGNGALSLKTDASPASGQDKAQYYNYAYYTSPLSLSDVTGELSYYTKQNSTTPDFADAAYQIPAYLQDSTNTNKFVTLTYEPYLDQGNSSIVNGQWQKWTINRSTSKFYVSHDVSNANGSVTGGQGDHLYTLDQINAIFPNAKVLGFGANVGSNNPGYDTEVDDFTFNNATYDFEPAYVNTSGPILSNTTPNDGSIVGGTFTVSTEATDPDGVASVSLKFQGTSGDSQTYHLTHGSGNTWSTQVSSKDFESGTGNYTLKFGAYDSLGKNRGNKSTHYTIDNTSPVIHVLQPSNNDLISGTATVRAEVTDDASGVNPNSVYVKFLVGGNTDASQAYYLHNVGGNIYEVTVDTTQFAPQDGTFTVKAVAKDNAGNSRSNKSVTGVVVDNVAPTITVKASSVGDTSAKIFSNVSFKLFDAHQVDKYDINGHVSDFGNNNSSDANFQNIKNYLNEGGSNTLKLYDVAGNSSTYTFIYDNEAPVVTLNTPAPNANLSGTVSITGSVTDNVKLKNYYLTVFDLDDNSVVYSRNFDRVSNINGQLASWNTTGLNGNYRIVIEARDAANNKDGGRNPLPATTPGASIDYVDVYVDNTAPEVMYINRHGTDELTNHNDVTFLVKFSETTTDPAASNFTLNTTGSAHGTVSSVTKDTSYADRYYVNVTSVGGNGNLQLKFNSAATPVVTDLAGNPVAADYADQSYTIDNAAPSITHYAYSNNGNLTKDDVTVTITTSEPVVTPTDWTQVDSTHFTKVFAHNGGFYIDLTDLVGNSTTVGGKAQGAEVKRIDKNAPVISGIADGATVTGTVHLSITDPAYEGADGLDANHGLSVNGADVSTTAGANKTYLYDISADGTYTVIATDKAGNATTAVHFTIDNTGPNLGYNGYDKVGNVITPKYTDLDTGNTYQWTAGSSNPSGVGIFDASALNPDFTVTKTGDYTFSLTATDSLGNPTSYLFSFHYDAPAPTLVRTTTPQPQGGDGSPAAPNSGPFTAVTSNPQVLGATTDTAAKDGNVKGDSTTKDLKTGGDTVKNSANKSSNFFGLGWWWLLVLAAVLAGWWFFFGARRRKDEN